MKKMASVLLNALMDSLLTPQQESDLVEQVVLLATMLIQSPKDVSLPASLDTLVEILPTFAIKPVLQDNLLILPQASAN